ncbi:MAG: DNA mismatch repair endonuclease MutL [Clostridia bacterium]|nr:DNA mismatch repair endonuclease MutL [Clostridia bacterium]
MAKINILPAKVYNRIAAGEVVDRPYSVVKELVENAIDAGATEVEISIEKGGKQLIRVVDNGCGIARDDLQSAFLPHATSKIAKAEDLENILTLGFRGEAVASIASVSRMTITSKTADGQCYSLTSNGGELGQIFEAAGENGTDVRVENLFYNTPVRYTFLKSDKGEETDITNVVSRFILNRPQIAFTYYADGKKVLQSFGGGDEEAIVGVYGPSILQNCYQINAERHGIKLRGYIGNQNFSKPNKSYQSVFLNGRYVVNATISAAISGAYQSYLMKRQYPFYVLHITVPTQIVDVNVHPNKIDVRFADNQMIYGCIYSVISAVLDGQSRAMEYIVPSKHTMQVVEKTASEAQLPTDTAEEPVAVEEERTERVAHRAEVSYKSTLLDEEPKTSPVLYQLEKGEEAQLDRETLKKIPGVELPFNDVDPDDGYVPTIKKEDIPEFTGELVTEEEQRAKGLFRKCDRIAAAKQLHKKFPDLYFEPNILRVESPDKTSTDKPTAEAADVFEENKRYLEQLEKEHQTYRIEIDSCRYVGKLFNTYLLYERKDEVLLIDQHAAHERLIFDKLRAQMENKATSSQPMLLPYELQLNAFEATFIEERIEDIRAMGFTIERKGNNTFAISAIPLLLQGMKVDMFFNEILGDVSGFRSIKLADLLRDKLAMAACKAAVKGGMDITQEEIDRLFTMMDGNMGLKCPHGRPVVTKITRTELEKMFKRKL